MIRYEETDPWYLRHSEALSFVALVAMIIGFVVWLGVHL